MSFFLLYFHDATSAQERPQTPLDASRRRKTLTKQEQYDYYMQNIWNNIKSLKRKDLLWCTSVLLRTLTLAANAFVFKGKYIELLIGQWSVQRRVQKRIRPMRGQQFKTEKRERGQARNVLTPPSELLDSMVQTKVGYIHGNSKLKVPQTLANKSERSPRELELNQERNTKFKNVD